MLLEGSAQPGLAALAVTADDAAEISIDGSRFSLARTLQLPAGGQAHLAFYVAAGPERDGAEATAAVLRRRGWRALLAGTRDALQQLEQSTGSEGVDRLINRNLLFAYFFAVARALDDAHYYLVRTRAPWHGAGVTVRDWDALMWTLPAVQLADAGLARELLLRMCELHGYAPGRGVHYLDGTLFEPGFALEGVAAYPIADRPLRARHRRRRDRRRAGDRRRAVSRAATICRTGAIARVPLYSTEVTPANEPRRVPVHAARERRRRAGARDPSTHARRGDRRAPSRIPPRCAPRSSATSPRSVTRRAFSARRSISSARARVTTCRVRAPSGCRSTRRSTATDSLYRRTVKAIPRDRSALVREIGRLLGPESEDVLQWLRRAPLHGGLAAEIVDENGRRPSRTRATRRCPDCWRGRRGSPCMRLASPAEATRASTCAVARALYSVGTRE